MAERAKAPRFPYVAALLCAACVGAAGYLWMRYSYAWPMRPTDLLVREQTFDSFGSSEDPFTWIEEDGSLIEVYLDNSRADMFVKMKGTYFSGSISGTQIILISDDDMKNMDIPLLTPPPDPPRHLSKVALEGRLLLRHHGFERLVFDPTASRFTGASIAGLVVGAMGVFVFAVALRHWLGERGTAREAA